MKRLTAVLMFLGIPAFAHHEVVLVTSMMPLMSGLAIIAAGAAVVVRQYLRKNLLGAAPKGHRENQSSGQD